MGRKPKYATLSTYQPYIDIIRADLGIPNTHYIEFIFREYRTRYGYASKYRVGIDNRLSKKDVLLTLMHELKHVQQRISRKFKDSDTKGVVVWDGHKQPLLSSRNKDYNDQPWEVEAYAYEKEIDRLFPNLELPPRRTLIGETKQGTKIYKLRKEYL